MGNLNIFHLTGRGQSFEFFLWLVMVLSSLEVFVVYSLVNKIRQKEKINNFQLRVLNHLFAFCYRYLLP